MPTWGEINVEINRLTTQLQQTAKEDLTNNESVLDIVRRKYLKELADHTGRSVIVYASSWLESRPIPNPTSLQISEHDMIGFMEVVSGLPKGSLDLIIHSPGGDGNAAKTIMEYLRHVGFSHIRAIVPVCAMSAGTMMALQCDEILMGHHSRLGPIDPQFTLMTVDGPRSAPAQSILDQFNLAKKEISEDPDSMAAWMPILRYYGPGLLTQCLSAQEDAEELVMSAMKRYMFKDDKDEDKQIKANNIAKWFNDHNRHKSHGKTISYLDAFEQGVKVQLIEDSKDTDLQDKVLSAWHGIQHTLSRSAVNKIIENNAGKAWILSGSPGYTLQFEPSPDSQVLKSRDNNMNQQLRRSAVQTQSSKNRNKR